MLPDVALSHSASWPWNNIITVNTHGILSKSHIILLSLASLLPSLPSFSRLSSPCSALCQDRLPGLLLGPRRDSPLFGVVHLVLSCRLHCSALADLPGWAPGLLVGRRKGFPFGVPHPASSSFLLAQFIRCPSYLPSAGLAGFDSPPLLDLPPPSPIILVLVNF